METQVYGQLVRAPRRNDRLRFVNRYCAACYGSWTEKFIGTLTELAVDQRGGNSRRNVRGKVRAIFRGENVLEIGCGRRGGLAEYVLAHGARSYIGFDIDKDQIKECRETVRDERAKFIADDPVFLLFRSLEKYLTISSGVMADEKIITNLEYGELLVRGIARVTRPGGYAVHQTSLDFDALFENFGFKEMFPKCNFMTRVYRKK
jgi:hypothetical protein